MNKNKTKVHIIHHTHWDMEWYFTGDETNVLLNYTVKDVIKNLNKYRDETFLFDGQTSPFEGIANEPVLYSDFKEKVESGQLLVGPWYSQPDMRQTSLEGLLRNYQYGMDIPGIKIPEVDYIYNPDSFGFSENIPNFYNVANKKWGITWRGLNRKIIDNNVVYKWRSPNGKESLMYNIASGYFVGRYLYDDNTFSDLYENNIKPTIAYQSENGKYKNVALPSGGDQQPYNANIKDAIKRLNGLDDGCEYVLSSWSEFLKELENEIDYDSLKVYEDQMSLSYGGRVHKPLGAHRPDIKSLIFKSELYTSRILEPMILAHEFSRVNYPKRQLDQLWKNVLLSQAHDSYASCNSDRVNKNIKNRLNVSWNIYEANRDMIFRIHGLENANKIIIPNTTNFSGETTFMVEVASLMKGFKLEQDGVELPYIVTREKEFNGGVNVIYTAEGEIENQKPNINVFNIVFKAKVESFKPTYIDFIDADSLINNKGNSFTKIENNVFSITTNDISKDFKIKFTMDGGDGYDLDIDPMVDTIYINSDCIESLTVKEANGIEREIIKGSIQLPNSIETWKNSECVEKTKFEIIITKTDEIKIELSFDNIQKSTVAQIEFNRESDSDKHIVLTHGGFIERPNDITNQNHEGLRESLTNFDLTHGTLLDENTSISSLESREYMIDNKIIIFNLFRTPDVLGRAELLSRPGRASGLADFTIPTPDSTSEIQKFKYSFYINKRTEKLDSQIVNRILMEETTYHAQSIWRYNVSVGTWTLPSLEENKSYSRYIDISNDKIILEASYISKDSKQYIVRISNPTMNSQKASLTIFGETQEVELTQNEIKEFKKAI